MPLQGPAPTALATQVVKERGGMSKIPAIVTTLACRKYNCKKQRLWTALEAGGWRLDPPEGACRVREKFSDGLRHGPHIVSRHRGSLTRRCRSARAISRLELP